MKSFHEFISRLDDLVSFNSARGIPEGNAPFGPGVRDSLNYVLDIAKLYGFETYNYDNYIGEIAWGEGEEIGIIGHVDVVPVSTGWNSPPFTLTEKDEKFYARGVVDDKGPVLITLFALRELKDSGMKFNRRIRFFIGCDEERDWKDIEYLKTKTTIPYYGFSPDGDFPLSYAEKGVLQLSFNFPELRNFYRLYGGTVVNAVCAEACAMPRTTKQIDKKKLKQYKLKTDRINGIASYGKAAHGSQPKKGKNAMLNLFRYLRDMGEDVTRILECLFFDKYGLDKMHNEQGKVTLSPNILRTERDGTFTIVCDCRIPAPFTSKDVLEVVDKFGFKYTAEEKHPPFMVDKDGFFVQTLLSAYKQVTGDEKAKPISMGGSTFARAFSKGCSFGIEFPDEPCNPHQANECISRKAIEKAYDIYKLAIENLVK